MSHLARKILFSLFVAAFCMIGTGLIFYANGYRFDFRSMSIEKTGGIYIISRPHDAQITLGGRAVQNTANLISPGTLISDLLSSRYSVTVSAPDYHSWKKDILVEPSLVAVYDQVVLVPGPDKAMLDYQTTSTTGKINAPIDDFAPIEGDNFLLDQAGRLTYRHLNLPGNQIVAVSKNGFLITKNQSGEYWLINLAGQSVTAINPAFNELKTKKLHLPGVVSLSGVTFSPLGDENLVVETPNALYELDLNQGTVNLISLNVSAFNISQNNIYWLDQSGLHRYDPLLQSKNDVTTLPSGINASAFSISNDGNSFAVLGKDSNFYLGSTGGGFEEIAQGVNDFSFSSDSHFLAAATKSGMIELYDLTRDKLFTLDPGLKSDIDEIVWYRDNAHLFLKVGDRLYFSEIDTKNPPLNVALITPSAKTDYYDPAANLLYFTDGQKIWQLAI